MQAEDIPQQAIEALADLLLDIAQHHPCAPSCICCGNEPSHTADSGQCYFELCMDCPIDAQPVKEQENYTSEFVDA